IGSALDRCRRAGPPVRRAARGIDPAAGAAAPREAGQQGAQALRPDARRLGRRLLRPPEPDRAVGDRPAPGRAVAGGGADERGTIPKFDRLAIETTGLADPAPIIFTLMADPVLRHHFRVGHVVTTVDAVNGATHLTQHPESVKQVAVADRVVLTKTDLTGQE